ncbi:DNA alkylation repair protein [Candidatus Woesearchaeota archaeon]|nr:DNA alkylation repair protein [Candidatus Woesearchaeota archaeon]
MNSCDSVSKSLKNVSSPDKAKILQRFFKTSKGEYGYGDVFIGVVVPVIRKISKKCTNISLKECEKLLHSRIHEERLASLFILSEKFLKGNDFIRTKIVRLYLKNIPFVNNWDLVDSSAHKILGRYLLDKNRNILFTLARSKNLWARRISIISTLEFIRNKQYDDSLKISEILLNDNHDLIHKAVGWILREVGKKDRKSLEIFLNKYSATMPRTMLRYAIEKFSKKDRTEYIKTSKKL